MKTNKEILKERIEKFNKRSGPRVGDYVYIPSTDDRIPAYTRITHDWGDKMQTGGNAGSSYYLGSGFLSYSGGLDPGIDTEDLIQTNEVKNGSIWFFDKDISGAGRGVSFNLPMRVFTVREGADISGVYSRNCPFYLTVLDNEMHGRTCGYWYTITRHAISHTAFRTEEELKVWLKENRLELSEDLTPAGTISEQILKYAA